MYTIKSDEWELIKDSNVWYGRYPRPKYGCYRPQPSSTPDKFPCLMREITVSYNCNGPDDSVVVFEYDFEEEE